VIVDGGPQDSTAANDKAALTVRLTAAGGPSVPAGWGTLGGAALLIIGALAFRTARRRRIRGRPVLPRQRRPTVEVSVEAYHG
jgi:hypothetical protein